MTLFSILLMVLGMFTLYLGLIGLFGPGVPVTQEKMIRGGLAKVIALTCLVAVGVICSFVF